MAITAVNNTTLLQTLMSIEHGSGEKNGGIGMETSQASVETDGKP